MTKEMVMEISSVGELSQGSAERWLLQAQAVALESLDDIKETSRVLRERTCEIRARLPQAQVFIVDRTHPGLPRTALLRTAVSAF